jgi:hypothetical protein
MDGLKKKIQAGKLVSRSRLEPRTSGNPDAGKIIIRWQS